jgi:SAM-dependent methyltransferase
VEFTGLRFQQWICEELLRTAAYRSAAGRPMADPIFENRRLAAIYDALEADRGDLDAYVAIVDEFSSRSVLDIGCGTGTFACLLAHRGIPVIGVDPASASLDVARGKPGADLVQWMLGDATGLPPLSVDMVTMTGNVAQVFLTDDDWAATLRGAHAALAPTGRLVFETRDPDRRAWLDWTRERSRARVTLPGVGEVESWVDLVDVRGELVSFRWTYVFAADGAELTSDSTLRFRDRDEIVNSLSATGFELDDIRGATDRPGRELVFVARPREKGIKV